VREVMLDHAERLVAWGGERGGLPLMRKYATWYTKGFPGSAELRVRLTRMTTLDEMRAILAPVPGNVRFPPAAMRVPRGKASGTQKVSLPEGYLDDLETDASPCAAAEVAEDGG